MWSCRQTGTVTPLYYRARNGSPPMNLLYKIVYYLVGIGPSRHFAITPRMVALGATTDIGRNRRVTHRYRLTRSGHGVCAGTELLVLDVSSSAACSASDTVLVAG
jgi:hypothetical protein